MIVQRPRAVRNRDIDNSEELVAGSVGQLHIAQQHMLASWTVSAMSDNDVPKYVDEAVRTRSSLSRQLFAEIICGTGQQPGRASARSRPHCSIFEARRTDERARRCPAVFLHVRHECFSVVAQGAHSMYASPAK
jgi:hypothetical protein